MFNPWNLKGRCQVNAAKMSFVTANLAKLDFSTSISTYRVLQVCQLVQPKCDDIHIYIAMKELVGSFPAVIYLYIMYRVDRYHLLEPGT